MKSAKVLAAKPTGLSLNKVMAELKAQGTDQNIKVYGNHGVSGKMYGVSYAFLKKLVKRVKTDHELAIGLWETEIHDARIFACWTADADRTTMKLLNSWARDVDNPVLGHEVVSLAQDTHFASKIMDNWLARKGEWISAMGWEVASRLVMQPGRGPGDGGLTEERVGELLSLIESNLHDSPNRTRHNMNEALISIGCRPKWKTRALKTAKRVGKIEVDYGATSCSVTDAAKRIVKTVAHYAAKGLAPTDGSGGKRRRHR